VSVPRVWVTGLGLVTALGREVEESWARALTARSAIRALTGSEWGGSPMKAAGVVDDADLAVIDDAFPAEVAAGVNRSTRFALWAARAALADAGLAAPGGSRAGAVVGAGLGVVRLEDVARSLGPDGRFDARRFAAGNGAVRPDSQIRWSADLSAASIARPFGLGGPSLTVTTACASATQAIGTASRLIRSGEVDWAVCGGTDSMLHPVGLVYFVLLRAASQSADPPETVCRPFDRRRTGLVMGEGAGMVVLESEPHARARGARPWAELAGYGTSMDAYEPTAPHPQGEGAARAMTTALADAGLTPGDIDYINAHGTGTKRNDPVETLAIRTAFGAAADGLCVTSSKPFFGHLLAACGGAECVLTALTVARGVVPPTLNLTAPDPKCDLDYVPGRPRERMVRAALSNSFGFGGQNGCLVLRRVDGAAGR
jgi:3-oxoacyl-[acyl-carrier-protein] synthase II